MNIKKLSDSINASIDEGPFAISHTDAIKVIEKLQSALAIALEGLEKIAQEDTFLTGGDRSCATSTIAKVKEVCK
jgi:uncharacterized protein YciI